MTTTEAPTWDQYMLPAPRVLADGEVQRARQICNAAADHLSVSAEEREVLIPSGQQRYLNRSLWALSYLSRAGAVERVSRGQYRITQVGQRLAEAVGVDLPPRGPAVVAPEHAARNVFLADQRASGRRIDALALDGKPTHLRQPHVRSARLPPRAAAVVAAPHPARRQSTHRPRPSSQRSPRRCQRLR